jgi:hypothetical protein
MDEGDDEAVCGVMKELKENEEDVEVERNPERH